MTGSPDAAVVAVVTTAPDVPMSESLATQLVEERLAACANVLPGVTSIYRWEGVLQKDSEVLLVLKTTEEAVSALTARILDLHPYDTPEVLALPVTDGSPAYLSWVREEVDVSG